jgi:hypothetical protein
MKTNEYFGSGASAHHGVLVSQAIARALNDAGVRGASFKPFGDPTFSSAALTAPFTESMSENKTGAPEPLSKERRKH